MRAVLGSDTSGAIFATLDPEPGNALPATPLASFPHAARLPGLTAGRLQFVDVHVD
jgi:hypothetical protein